MLIGPSRPEDQAPVCGEFVNARKVFADEQVARNRSLNVMGQSVRRIIYVVGPEGRLVAIVDILIAGSM